MMTTRKPRFEPVEWRPVLGWDGLYEVSEEGEVRSLDRVCNNGRRCKGRIMRLNPDSHGYLQVGLSLGGIARTVLVHTLVCESFIGPKPEGQEVLHGLLGKTNNTPTNLRYGTRSENLLDRRFEPCYNGKPVVNSRGERFASMAIAAEEFGVSRHCIYQACQYGHHSAGLHWRKDGQET